MPAVHRRPRVKLITIPWELEVPTLTLASVAAATPPQLDVAIVDILRERPFLDEEVDLVGLTASTPRINAAYALAAHYRARGARVVIGGHHATAMPEEALQHCDAVVCGEGETAWRRLCEDFLSNPSRVQGIYRADPPDLSTLPQPRVDLVRFDRYSPWTYPVIATRGCPEQCSFCFAKRMTRGYRTYPISHVLEQIRRRPEGTRALYFVDDNLAGDLDFARELFRALARDPIPFGMQVRHELALDGADLELARRAGCTLVSCGYESINQDSLDGTAKRALAHRYRDASRAIFGAGMIPSGNWMFGFDWDQTDVFARTLEFLDTTDLLHCNFSTEIPFPGTAAWKRYRAEGRLLDVGYERYVGKDRAVVRPRRMTPRQLERGVRWIGRHYYSVGRATRRVARALRNPRLTTGPLGKGALLFLNYAQVLQWRRRAVPALRWLYDRLVPLSRYRYLGDLLRRSSFEEGWAPPPRPPSSAGAGATSPFFSRSGHKRGPRSPFVLGIAPTAPEDSSAPAP